MPFNKKEVEDFINDRRALSAKQLFKLQNQLKKDRISKKQPQINNSKDLHSVSIDKLSNEEVKIVNPSGVEEKWNLDKKTT